MPTYRPASVPLWLSPDRIVIGGASGAGRFGAAAAALALDAPAAPADATLALDAPAVPADAAVAAPALDAPLASPDAGGAPPPAAGGAAGARDGALHASARSKAPSAPQRPQRSCM